MGVENEGIGCLYLMNVNEEEGVNKGKISMCGEVHIELKFLG